MTYVIKVINEASSFASGFNGSIAPSTGKRYFGKVLECRKFFLTRSKTFYITQNLNMVR